MTGATLLVDVLTAIMIFFLAVNSFHAVLICCSIGELWSHWQLAEDDYFRTLLGTEALSPVSVLLTTYNQRDEVMRTIHSMLDLDYPRYEVVVVDDGSSDGTLDALVNAFDMTLVSPAFMVSVRTEPVRGYYRSRTHPRLLVIDKGRGGQADALNAGLNAARFPYVLIASGTILLERDALLRLMRPFLLNRSVSAVGGGMRITDGTVDERGRRIAVVPSGTSSGVRMVEYLRTFVFQRLGWNHIASNLMFPDRAVLIRREQLLAVGGFRTDTPTPGTDIIVRLQQHLTNAGINPLFLALPDLVAWSTSPDDMVLRGEKRTERQIGLLRVLRAHRRMCFNPEQGAFGMIALPYYWIAWVIAPPIELLGYVGIILGGVMGVLPPGFLWAYAAAVLGYGVLLSVWVVLLEASTVHRYARLSDFARLLMYAVAEPLGRRQSIAWFRTRAFFS